MSEMPDKRSEPKGKFSPLRVLVGVLIGVVILIVFIPPPTVSPQVGHRIICQANLKSLCAALYLYAEDHGGKYPPPERWCDCLVGSYDREENFRCRGGEGGRCDYAINPLADPCSPRDTVLLFECSSGWNRCGGVEVLTTKHHEDKGVCVAFVEGSVRFVKAEEVPALRWDGSLHRKQEDMQPFMPGAGHRQSPEQPN